MGYLLNGTTNTIVYTVLVGILILGLLPLFIASFFVIPQKSDAARRGLIWLKVALGLMCLGVALVTASTILAVQLDAAVSVRLTKYYGIAEAQNRLNNWGVTLIDISAVFTFLSILDIDVGILLCWDSGRRFRSILRWVGYGLAFVCALLVIVKLGGYEAYFSRIYGALRASRYTSSRYFLEYRYVSIASTILLFVMATGLLILSIVVMVQARKNDGHHQSAKLQLVASCLFWIMNLFSMLTTILFFWYLAPFNGEVILEAFLGPWLQFITLAILFAVGRKKLHGLYATPQHIANKPRYGGYDD